MHKPQFLHDLGFGGPEEDHQLDHCCWTGRVSKREEEEEEEEEGRHYKILWLC